MNVRLLTSALNAPVLNANAFNTKATNVKAMACALMLGLGAISVAPTTSYAASEIKQDMKQMKQAYRAALKSDNMADFAKAVTDLQNKTAAAAKLSYKPNNPQLSDIYKQGMLKLKPLYAELDQAIKTGNLAQGKAVLQKIKDTERKFHKDLDV